jgi:TonB family protein
LPEQSASTAARLARGAAPTYPTLARQEGIEADVPMELVVSARGAVESARVLGHVGFGLDEAALGAIRGYAFTPAIKDGRPTRVRMRWTMQFRLR